MRCAAPCVALGVLAAVLVVGCADTPPSPNRQTADAIAVNYDACLMKQNYGLDCKALPRLRNLTTGKTVAAGTLDVVAMAGDPTGLSVGTPYELSNIAGPSLAAALFIDRVSFDYTAPAGGDGANGPAMQCLRSDGLACSDPNATWKAIVPVGVAKGPGQTEAEHVQVVVHHVDSAERSAELCFHFLGEAGQKGPFCVVVRAKTSP